MGWSDTACRKKWENFRTRIPFTYKPLFTSLYSAKRQIPTLHIRTSLPIFTVATLLAAVPEFGVELRETLSCVLCQPHAAYVLIFETSVHIMSKKAVARLRELASAAMPVRGTFRILFFDIHSCPFSRHLCHAPHANKWAGSEWWGESSILI